jgi:hypothetical protein
MRFALALRESAISFIEDNCFSLGAGGRVVNRAKVLSGYCMGTIPDNALFNLLMAVRTLRLTRKESDSKHAYYMLA